MNKHIAVALLLALLVIALLGSGAAGYMYLSNRLELADIHTQAAEAHAAGLETQLAELNETAQLCEERGREIATLRNKAAELERQVAELKSNRTILRGRAVQWQREMGDQIILGGLTPAVQEPIKETVLKVPANVDVLTRPPQNAPRRRLNFATGAEVRRTEPEVIVDELPVGIPGGDVRVETQVIRKQLTPIEEKFILPQLETKPEPARKAGPTTEQF